MFCISLSFGGCPTQTTMKIKRFFPFKDHDSLSPLFQCSVWLAEVFSSIPPKKNVSIHFLTTARNGPWGKQKSEKDLWNFHYPRPISGFANRPWRCLWVKKMISIPCWSRSVWGRGVYPIHHFQEWSLSQDSIPSQFVSCCCKPFRGPHLAMGSKSHPIPLGDLYTNYGSSPLTT